MKGMPLGLVALALALLFTAQVSAVTPGPVPNTAGEQDSYAHGWYVPTTATTGATPTTASPGRFHAGTTRKTTLTTWSTTASTSTGLSATDVPF